VPPGPVKSPTHHPVCFYVALAVLYRKYSEYTA
jgi:hypothetical protein